MNSLKPEVQWTATDPWGSCYSIFVPRLINLSALFFCAQVFGVGEESNPSRINTLSHRASVCSALRPVPAGCSPEKKIQDVGPSTGTELPFAHYLHPIYDIHHNQWIVTTGRWRNDRGRLGGPLSARNPNKSSRSPGAIGECRFLASP